MRKLNYNPESESFILDELEEDLSGVLIVLSKEQLEDLIKLYDRCIGVKKLLEK